MAKARRYAILYVYTEVYGCAPENKWDDFDDNYGMRLPTIIMKHLMIPRGSYQAVITAMREMYAAHENGETYDPSGNMMSRCGAKVKIVELSTQAKQVYRSMEKGMGLGNTLVLLNAWRRRNLLPGPISYGALQRFVAQSPVLKIDKRELRKASAGNVSPSRSSRRRGPSCPTKTSAAGAVSCALTGRHTPAAAQGARLRRESAIAKTRWPRSWFLIRC